MTEKTSVTLPNGDEMPLVGYGTWQAQDIELEKAFEAALEAGYRHIDTAAGYANEHVIGKVLQRWLSSGKAKREDFFITTKIPTFGNRPSSVEKYLRLSLKKLQLDYLDLYLIHGPFAVPEELQQVFPMKPDGTVITEPFDLIGVWKALENLVDQGLTRSIGVSNFNENQIQRILDVCRIKPANQQVEIHLYFQQEPMVKFCREKGIPVTAYSPLGSRGVLRDVPEPFNHPVVLQIAKSHNKTPAQVLLRYTLQRGIIVIPKSTNPDRLRQNFTLFDFRLTSEEMDKLKGLDKGPAARTLDFGRMKGMRDYHEFPF